MIQIGGRSGKRSALELEEKSGAAESLAQSSAHSGRSTQLTVVTYNLYWWNVKQNNRWGALHDRIRGERPFDLVGFQECEDVATTLSGSGLGGFGFFQGPSPNPAPMAWNLEVFTAIGEPASKQVAEDQWGKRWMNWVRLQHKATGTNVLFVNTHGPLNDCGSTVGNNWAEGVRANRQSGDVLFMTGDYNCGSGTQAMQILKGLFKDAVDGGIDQILTSTQVISGGTRAGQPSDHPLVNGLFALPAQSPSPKPSPAPTPSPKPSPAPTPSPQPSPAPAPSPQPAPAPTPGNHYRKVSNVGGWGGWCTCPDGLRYNVGDNFDGCANGPASLACEGGSPGACDKIDDSIRSGMKVTCAVSALPVPKPSPSPQPSTPTPTPENHYRKVDNVGSWGGWCTCPDGQRYKVGDNDDGCGSLACDGGDAGECVQQLDWSRHGMKVTCAAARPSAASPTPCKLNA